MTHEIDSPQLATHEANKFDADRAINKVRLILKTDEGVAAELDKRLGITLIKREIDSPFIEEVK